MELLILLWKGEYCSTDNNIKERVMFKYFEMMIIQLTETLFNDYISRKNKADIKKCVNCCRRVGLELIECPYCKHSDFFFIE